MNARPGGPAAKREPSPEGLGLNSEDDLPAPACRGSAVGAALNLGPLAHVSLGPKRTRISCHVALGIPTCAAFRKEGRMQFANASDLNRKFGVPKWRDLRFSPSACKL
jgi:hypothetical protein